jgi:hypothetical protein
MKSEDKSFELSFGGAPGGPTRDGVARDSVAGDAPNTPPAATGGLRGQT